MTTTPPGDGYTLAYCSGRSCTDPPDLHLPGELAALTRASRHGVLIRAGCVLGPTLCHSCGPRTGRFLLVQATSGARQRRPHDMVVPVGPLRTPQDLEALRAWLQRQELRDDLLPRRLRLPAQLLRSATSN